MTAQQEVAAILKRTKWSAYRLAKNAGVSTTTITRIVAGKTAYHDTMEKIREAAKSK